MKFLIIYLPPVKLLILRVYSMEMAFHIHWLHRLIRMDSHKDFLLCLVCLLVSWRKFLVYHQPKAKQQSIARYIAEVQFMDTHHSEDVSQRI